MPEPHSSRAPATQACLGISETDPVVGKQLQAGFAHSHNDTHRRSDGNSDLSEDLEQSPLGGRIRVMATQLVHLSAY